MRVYITVLLLALSGADDHDDFLVETINKIPSIVSPTSTIENPISGSGTLSFSTKSFNAAQENFVLVKSTDGTFKSTYNILAHLHKDAVAMKLLDASYGGRLTIAFNGGVLKVDISGVDSTDRDFYTVFSITDPMKGKIDVEVDDHMYQANVYTGDIKAQYTKVGDKWLLFAYQQASGVAKISSPDGVIFNTASDDEKTTAGLADAGTVMVAGMPIADWFGNHRGDKYITIKSAFSETKVLRFFDAQDMQSNVKPVLVDWLIEYECGPVPAEAVQVELIAGNFASEVEALSRVDISTLAKNGDMLEFKKITAKPDMVGGKGGLTCRFFSADDRNLGSTVPTSYIVHDKESDRPTFDVAFKETECGWIVGENQEIATCSVPVDQIASVFPPIRLQWEITLADGSVSYYPTDPVETMSLPLTVPIVEGIKGAQITCLDRRSPDPKNEADHMPNPPDRTVPSNPADLTLRKYTKDVIIEIIDNYSYDCKSDAFGLETRNENVCSDVEQWDKQAIICPYTKTNGNITCTAILVTGEQEANDWINPNCAEYHPDSVPCEDSSVKKCPPPATSAPETGGENGESGEAGSSKLWLIFFLIAAAGGAVLIFINKRKNKNDTKAEATHTDSNNGEENSLLDQGGVTTTVNFDTEVTPPPTVKAAFVPEPEIPVESEKPVETEKPVDPEIVQAPELYPDLPLIDEQAENTQTK